ncbi:hypothetical protein BC830DRAFT_1127209 [Chytriomyces sp. MP71]|nr:hypothetical protein BC830DRAFT_1127209 [Chytriomyces sp. MP71]
MTEKELLRQTKTQLMFLATQRGLIGVTTAMRKDEMVAALVEHQTAASLTADNVNTHVEADEGVSDLNETETVGEDLNVLSRNDLVKMAKKFSLKATGKKSDLIHRIENSSEYLASCETKHGVKHSIVVHDDSAQLESRVDTQKPVVTTKPRFLDTPEKAFNAIDAPRESLLTQNPPQVTSTLFCCIERDYFHPSYDHSCPKFKAPPGTAILKSGVVWIRDNQSMKEFRLKLAVNDGNGELPDGYEDNVVCHNCIDRNRAMGLFGLNKAPTKLSMAKVAVHPKLLAENFTRVFGSTSGTVICSDVPSANNEPLHEARDQLFPAEASPTNTDKTNAFLDQTLDEISIIESAADDVLAALEMCDEMEKQQSNTKKPSASSSAVASPRRTIPASPLRTAPRSAIKRPLEKALHERRMSQHVKQAALAQHARERKVAEARGVGAAELEDEDTDTGSANSSFSSSSGRAGRLKLPASREERKARGEILWKDPSSRPGSALSTREAGVGGPKYVPVEDKQIAQAVESILETVERGSEEEWKLISGATGGLQRSP